MIDLNKKSETFVKKSSRNNSKLYLVNNLNDLLSSKLFSEKQLKNFKTNYKFNSDKPIINLFDFDQKNLITIAYLNPNKNFRESTIDQAAKICNLLEDRVWDLNILSQYNENDIYEFLLGWGLSFYKFNILKEDNVKKYVNILSLSNKHKKLVEPCSIELRGINLARDLINLPANYLNPDQYEIEIKKIFKSLKCKIHKGRNFDKEFPLISMVGRSSEFNPKLIEINWKNKDVKKDKNNVTIIGKGITFDSGGLDIKPSGAMLNMKKDMGGSAIAIGLAKNLILYNSKINLRLLIPIAENSISQKSMRPMDIKFSRNKTPVEIGNTDAEGRLILADTLSYAQEGKINPDLIIDFATLTGAARVALGTEVPVFFSNNENISKKLLDNSIKMVDPVWQLPLFTPYKRFLHSENGALNSTGFSGTGGAITAALFLEQFVDKKINWVHFDLMAWNLTSRPGFPKGGEAMSLRTVFKTINEMFN